MRARALSPRTRRGHDDLIRHAVLLLRLKSGICAGGFARVSARETAGDLVVGGKAGIRQLQGLVVCLFSVAQIEYKPLEILGSVAFSFRA